MGFPSAVLVLQGQSITGSFNRLQVLASGSFGPTTGSAFAPGHISALKDGNGTTISFNSSSAIYLPQGAVMELMITSASLDTTSAPIMFFKV
jgi:hypothetical protein